MFVCFLLARPFITSDHGDIETPDSGSDVDLFSDYEPKHKTVSARKQESTLFGSCDGSDIETYDSDDIIGPSDCELKRPSTTIAISRKRKWQSTFFEPPDDDGCIVSPSDCKFKRSSKIWRKKKRDFWTYGIFRTKWMRACELTKGS